MQSIPRGINSFASWITADTLIISVGTIALVFAAWTVWKMHFSLGVLVLAAAGVALWAAAPDVVTQFVRWFKGALGGGGSVTASFGAPDVFAAAAAAKSAVLVLLA